MKVYIAGKITGDDNYKEKFGVAETLVKMSGFVAMNPACLPCGFSWDDYMHICVSMIDVCDAVLFLDDWKESTGARFEHGYALDKGKGLFYSLEELRCVNHK